jgi:hypothetical protein
MICCNTGLYKAQTPKKIQMESTDEKMLEGLQTLYLEVETRPDENMAFLTHIHEEAERIRNRYGYSGGTDGAEYNELRNTQEMDVPYGVDGSFKTYMDYRTITNKRSWQWGLQTKAYTNKEGFRMIDGKYLVAMGTYYSKGYGEEFIITLDSGKELNVMVGDIKADRHTDSTNKYITRNGNIVEFIVDTNTLNGMSRKMGNVSYSGLWGGITKIEKIL